jgi:hypothetical protein
MNIVRTRLQAVEKVVPRVSGLAGEPTNETEKTSRLDSVFSPRVPPNPLRAVLATT